MGSRFAFTGVLLATTVGGLLMSAQMVTAPPAQACSDGQLKDPTTGMCWSQSGQGSSYGGLNGGPCLPGRLGDCVGPLRGAPRPNPLENPGPPQVVSHPCQDLNSYCDGGKYW